jgi:hypothetical protein
LTSKQLSSQDGTPYAFFARVSQFLQRHRQ